MRLPRLISVKLKLLNSSEYSVTWRSRRVKCDEGHPVRRNCTRESISCQYEFSTTRLPTSEQLTLRAHSSVMGTKVATSTQFMQSSAVNFNDVPAAAQIVAADFNQSEGSLQAPQRTVGTSGFEYSGSEFLLGSIYTTLIQLYIW